MKKILLYLILTNILLIMGISFHYIFKYKTVTFTLDEQVFWYSHLSWEETKLPTYWWHGIRKIRFFLKDVKQLPIIWNNRERLELDEKTSSEKIAFYYAYPLSRLQTDLFIDKAEVIFTDKHKSIFIDKNSSDSWRFTSYQKPWRKNKEILIFLSTLANFRTEEAWNMLMQNKNLLPFNGIHFEFKEIIAWEDKLYGKILFEWWWGPDLYDFQLFISKTTLYFLFYNLP